MSQPNRPTLLYDGDCGFCMQWIKRWERISRGVVVYEPYQEALSRFPQVTRQACEESVQLIMPNGSVIGGAHAVLRALVSDSSRSSLWWMYKHIPGFAGLCESVYRWVARHRKQLVRGKGETCRK